MCTVFIEMTESDESSILDFMSQTGQRRCCSENHSGTATATTVIRRSICPFAVSRVPVLVLSTRYSTGVLKPDCRVVVFAADNTRIRAVCRVRNHLRSRISEREKAIF